MGIVANNPGLFSLASLNDDTGWLDMEAFTSDVAFNITGTWSGTISLFASNQSDLSKTQVSTVATYTGNQSPLNIPRQIGRFVRFQMTGWVSGTAYIGFSKGLISGPGGQVKITDIAAQSQTGGGASTF